MKKRVFSLIIAFVFILTCAIGLSGCGDSSQSKVKSISCEVDNPHFNNEEGKFIYTWSSDLFIGILKSDFTVTAHYADGTSETVTDFTIDVPTIRYPLANENKQYTVKISYKNKSQQFVIDIRKLDPAAAKDFIRALQDIDVEYTGDDIDVVSRIEGLKEYIDAGAIKVNTNIGSRFERELGTYSLTILSADGAVEKTITWKIIKARIGLPLVNHTPLSFDEDNRIIYVELNIEYDELEHGVSLQPAEGTERLMTVYDAQTGTNENLPKYTEVGEYNFTIRTNEYYVFRSSKFDYNEEYSEAYVIMKIYKKRLDLSGENALSVTSPVYYTGSAITFDDLTTNISTDLFEIILFPSDCIDPGTYEIIVHPKLSTVINYAWNDGSEISSRDIHVNFQVLSAD